MISISIIIPVYNVEPYIEECLRSVMMQFCSVPIECLLIDDCGTDNSMIIAEHLLQEYSGPIQFRIFRHERNRGLSAARNTGIKNASGDYILFLDSDDELTESSIEYLSKPLIENDYDVVVGSYNLIGQGHFDILRINSDIKILTQEHIFKIFIAREIYEMAWNKLVRRNFLINNNIWFVEGLLHEDILWSFYLFYYSHKVKLLIAPTYKYRVRESGIIGQRNAKNVLHLKYIFEEKLKFINENSLQRQYPELIEYMLREKLALLKRCIIYNIDKSVFREIQQIKIPDSSIQVSIKTVIYLITSSLPHKIFSIVVRIVSPN